MLALINERELNKLRIKQSLTYSDLNHPGHTLLVALRWTNPKFICLYLAPAHVCKKKQCINQKKRCYLWCHIFTAFFVPGMANLSYRHIRKELVAVHSLPDIKNLVKAVIRKFISWTFCIFVFNWRCRISWLNFVLPFFYVLFGCPMTNFGPLSRGKTNYSKSQSLSCWYSTSNQKFPGAT